MNLKLKHKKLIVIAGFIVLGIGTLAFSLVNGSDKSGTGKDSAEGEVLNQLDAESQIASFKGKDGIISGDNSTQDTIQAETEEAEPELEVNADADIVELIMAYMDSKLEPNVEVFAKLVNDVSLIDIEAIERETNIIEKYDNITVYSIDASKEDVSLVYVYHDVKFVGIDTPAPAATRFLVVKEDDKAPFIFNGEVSEETKAFIAEFEETNAYDEFVEGVNTQLLAALDKDQVLAEFYAKLYESNSQAAAEDNQSSEPEETVEAGETEETTETDEIGEVDQSSQATEEEDQESTDN